MLHTAKAQFLGCCAIQQFEPYVANNTHNAQDTEDLNVGETKKHEYAENETMKRFRI